MSTETNSNKQPINSTPDGRVRYTLTHWCKGSNMDTDSTMAKEIDALDDKDAEAQAKEIRVAFRTRGHAPLIRLSTTMQRHAPTCACEVCKQRVLARFGGELMCYVPNPVALDDEQFSSEMRHVRAVLHEEAQRMFSLHAVPRGDDTTQEERRVERLRFEGTYALRNAVERAAIVPRVQYMLAAGKGHLAKCMSALKNVECELERSAQPGSVREPSLVNYFASLAQYAAEACAACAGTQYSSSQHDMQHETAKNMYDAGVRCTR